MGGGCHAPAAVPPSCIRDVYRTGGWVGPQGRSGKILRMEKIIGTHRVSNPELCEAFKIP